MELQSETAQLVAGREARNNNGSAHAEQTKKSRALTAILFVVLSFGIVIASSFFFRNSTNGHHHGIFRGHLHTTNNKQYKDTSKIVALEDAKEEWLDIGEEGIQIWFRTWGRSDGIPVVFIHGGPGNAIAEYNNTRFFADVDDTFFVVEIDQRGTGYSQPSVRDDWKNMKHYQDISIDKMCADFEAVRKHLGIDQWLVFGGSFGSTLAINYGERYPESSMALIIRGVYLDTAEEVYAVYSRKSYLDHPKRLHEFDILYQYAARYIAAKEHYSAVRSRKGDPLSSKNITDEEWQELTQVLDPNDAERLLRVYAEMISNGDHAAFWHWFVFENNLMEIDPRNILDPDIIDNQFYRESLSVAFFETHLWLHGSFDHPTSDLMNQDKIDRLTMPLWICQGQHDEVCPPKYARRFASAVEAAGKSPRVVARFLNATHEDTDPVMEECLQRSLKEFVDVQHPAL